MIIDAHGHYTRTPPQHQAFRDAQLSFLADASAPPPKPTRITDDQVRESFEAHHLTMLRDRGIDLVLFSPKASGMGHDVPDVDVAVTWARAANDLVHRVAELFPEHVAPVAQLPQTPDGSLEPVVGELRRCVEELGFVGCNVNPDPSGGRWTARAMTDEYWFPLYEALVELDVPAMIHVSASCAPGVHALGAHYLNADTTVFMQLVENDLFNRFPTLRFVIPHGGGAVPYHWGRYRGLAMRLGRPDPTQLLDNVFFDTCVYHQPGVDLLTRVVPVPNILFASEMLGAVRGADPRNGIAWDDTLRYVDRAGLSEPETRAVYELNARRVYPRLDRRLAAAGR